MENVAWLFETLKRSCIPEVLLCEDVALVLRLKVAKAARLIRSGALGPYAEVGGQLAIRRRAFLESLRR